MNCQSHARRLALVLILSPLLPALQAQSATTSMAISYGGVKERYSGDFHEITYAEAPARAPHPSEDVLEHVAVRWTTDVEIAEWQSTESLRSLRRTVCFRGRLIVDASQDGTVRMADWLQGVRVLVARQPGSAPDWTRAQEGADTAWGDAVVEADGSFSVSLTPFEIRRVPGGSASYQIGLSLSEVDGPTLRWNSTRPALANSIDRVVIPGPPLLSSDVQAINAVSGVNGHSFDPLALIRAVNHLRPLGKERAIAALWEYLALASDWFSMGPARPRDPANIDDAEPQCVFLIVRLLFVPLGPSAEQSPAAVRTEDKRAALLSGVGAYPRCGLGLPEPPGLECAQFRLHPLALECETPFVIVTGYLLAGSPEHPGNHLRWAEQYASLRPGPVVPLQDPIRAAAALFARMEGIVFSSQWMQELLRGQAMRALAGSPSLQTHAIAHGMTTPSPPSFQELASQWSVQGLIGWDDARQCWSLKSD